MIMVLPLLKALLDQPGNDGDKYVLFVTDGEPDFCDNGDAKCAVDAVVAGVQKLASAGIHTIVFGLKIVHQSTISGETLQAVANAGASLPAPTPFGATHQRAGRLLRVQGRSALGGAVAPGMLLTPIA